MAPLDKTDNLKALVDEAGEIKEKIKILEARLRQVRAPLDEYAAENATTQKRRISGRNYMVEMDLRSSGERILKDGLDRMKADGVDVEKYIAPKKMSMFLTFRKIGDE